MKLTNPLVAPQQRQREEWCNLLVKNLIDAAIKEIKREERERHDKATAYIELDEAERSYEVPTAAPDPAFEFHAEQTPGDIIADQLRAKGKDVPDGPTYEEGGK